MVSSKGTKKATQSIKRDYTYEMFRRKPVRKLGQDLRDVPTYTLPEAAASLAIPHRTLFYWFVGPYSILSPSDYYGDAALLSFRDVSEAYVLEILRTVHGFNFRQLRTVVQNAQREMKMKRPLADADLRVVFNRIVLNIPGRGRRSRIAVDLQRYPQLLIPPLVDLIGKRILRDEKHAPYRIYPWRLLKADSESNPVMIDPDVMSGRAVVTGTRIPLTLVRGMRKAGRSVEQIAATYRLPVDLVTKALLHIEEPIYKVA